MSYNIDTFDVAALTDLAVSLSAIEKVDPNGNYDREWDRDNALTIRLSEDGELSGRLDIDAIFHIDKVNLRGEGSGRASQDLKALLAHSTGHLVAILTWEHGDNFSLLEAHDGTVSNRSFRLLPLVDAIRAQIEAAKEKGA